MSGIVLDPVTRLEGHLQVTVERDDQNGTVSSAQSSGKKFHGFEILLQGKDPRDAVHITRRVCGVCPVNHAMASVLAMEAAAGFQATDNARMIRNLILGADFLHSHILHPNGGAGFGQRRRPDRSAAWGAGSLAQNQQPGDCRLPNSHADLLELLAQRRRRRARPSGEGAGGDADVRRGPAGRGAAGGAILRPMPVLRSALAATR